MRSLFVVPLLVTVACASSAPPPNASMGPPPPNASAPAPQSVVIPTDVMDVTTPPSATLSAAASGTIGGQQFVARSALMVRANEPFRACSTMLTGTGSCSTDKDGFDIKVSTIRIFERVVTCAEIGDQFRRHDIQLRPNERSIEIRLQATWPVVPRFTYSTEDAERDPRHDNIGATFTDGWRGGAIAKGTSQFPRATLKDGIVTFRFTTMNPKLPTSGSVSGTIPFTVCR